MIDNFETERLRMRPLMRGDAEALHGFYSDEAATRWWSHGVSADLDETRARVAESIEAPGWARWAITIARAGNDRAIGTLGAREEWQGGVFEIGYALVPDMSGQGYAMEAVGGLITQLFTAQGARRVFADTDPDNGPSITLLRRLGFTLEGRLRDEWKTHIGIRDSLIWGLLADEWARATRLV